MKNLVSGVLYEPISTSTTMLLVTIGENVGASAITDFFPTPPFYITVMPKSPTIGVANSLDSEIMKVTSVSHDQVGNAALICTRAQRGTTAKAFESGSIVTVGVYAEDVCFIGENQTEETEQPWVNGNMIDFPSFILAADNRENVTLYGGDTTPIRKLPPVVDSGKYLVHAEARFFAPMQTDPYGNISLKRGNNVEIQNTINFNKSYGGDTIMENWSITAIMDLTPQDEIRVCVKTTNGGTATNTIIWAIRIQ